MIALNKISFKLKKSLKHEWKHTAHNAASSYAGADVTLLSENQTLLPDSQIDCS